jgi:hypothetical protein
MDIGTFKIGKVIVHEVPKRRAGDEPEALDLSEVESPLDAGVKGFLTDKVKEALASAFEVEFMDGAESPVPGLVTNLLDNKASDLVPNSQKMAHRLYETQHGVMPGGLITVISGTVDADRPCCVILKLEKEQGTRLQSETVGGHRTFRLENIKELMLTDSTRIYKVALFVRPTDDAEPAGYVSDQQQSARGPRGVADFFLLPFLGCKFREQPTITTRRAWQATESFINTKVSDPATKTRYQVALMAEMNSNKPQFKPSQFANDHMDGPDRQTYLDHLGENGAPVNAFKKDTELISKFLAKVTIDTTHGFQVMGPRDEFDDRVTVKSKGTEAVVEVTDEIKWVGRR